MHVLQINLVEQVGLGLTDAEEKCVRISFDNVPTENQVQAVTNTFLALLKCEDK